MRAPLLDILVIEQMDPRHPAPGGIEGMIADVVRLSPHLTIGIIGISRRREARLGVWQQIPFGGGRVWFFPATRIAEHDRGVVARLPDSFRLVLGALRRRPALRARILHVHRIEYGALLALLRPRRYAQYIHNDSTGLLGARSDSIWRRLAPVYRALERLSLSRAISTGVFNTTDAPRLQRISPGVQVLRTWFDPEIFHPSPRSRAADGPVEVLWAGRFESQKDPLLALRVLAACRTAGDRVRLTMVGAGSMAGAIAHQIDQQDLAIAVRLPGSMQKREVASAMRASDVFLLTSHYEGSPTVLAEAMACGLPVVAAAEADPDGSIVDGRNGYRVDGRDPGAFTASILRAVALDRGGIVRAASSRSAARLVPAMLAIGRKPERRA